MKEKYQGAEMEIILFSVQDVITTSDVTKDDEDQFGTADRNDPWNPVF